MINLDKEIIMLPKEGDIVAVDNFIGILKTKNYYFIENCSIIEKVIHTSTDLAFFWEDEMSVKRSKIELATTRQKAFYCLYWMEKGFPSHDK